MKVLFLHPNFPGQFRHIAAESAKQENQVKFICQTHYGRQLPGVERLKLKNSSGNDELESKKLNILDRANFMAKQFRNAFIALRNQGWSPDLVISHSGWGCGIYVKEVWPYCKQISYLEWWFNPNSSFYSYDSENIDLGINKSQVPKNWIRNQHVALELCLADVIVSPTGWQRAQLPPSLKNRCKIIFDGIDTNEFIPKNQNFVKPRPVITYGTRGMEPMRAFPQMIKSLPKVLETCPNLTVEIAGDEKAYYGKGENQSGQTWKSWAIEFLSNKSLTNRIKWLGSLPFPEYKKWLKSSSSHIYLTHPFIASWSLVESYASGIPLVVSDVQPVQEICNPKDGITFVDHRSISAISEGIISSVSKINNTSNFELVQSRKIQRFDKSIALKLWNHVSDLEVTTTR